jgi:glyoxylase-like metal-dependent hydrolase (beta-lactamase superfamily II)
MIRCAPTILLLAAAAATAAAAADLPPGIHLVPGSFTPGTQPDGNSVVIEAPDGLIVVDTGRHAAHTQAVLDLASSLGKPIAAVVNTHWHLDHIGGNARVRAAYPEVRVYAGGALADALTGFLADYRAQLADNLAKSRLDSTGAAALQAEIALIDAGPALLPDVVITHSTPRVIAGRSLVVGLAGPAVTAGDVWIQDPATRVMIAGDLVTLPVPFLDTACPEGWQAALDHLARFDFAVLIPGHGAPLTRAEFETYRTAFANLRQRAASDAPAEACLDGWLLDLGPLVPEPEHDFARQLLTYYLDQHLRGDPERTAKLCAH